VVTGVSRRSQAAAAAAIRVAGERESRGERGERPRQVWVGLINSFSFQIISTKLYKFKYDFKP
jgi:hypothetical protein